VTKLTMGSMFAGIGGMELGFEATGQIETKWQVEIDDYANQILAQHWPGVARWKDVRTFPPRPAKDWSVDIIAGGFPCQDISTANGKAEGLDGERSGLFAEIIRVARIIQPRAIVLENVAALYFRGMDRVLGELAQIGYDAEWHCVSAASVGAPHRRDRVFIIATNAGSIRCNARRPKQSLQGVGPYGKTFVADTDGPYSKRGGLPGGISAENPDAHGAGTGSRTQEELADTTSQRQPGPGVLGRSEHKTPDTNRKANNAIRRSKGKTLHWLTEPDVGRVANGVPRRVDRLKCLGNAIVPQVAEVVGRRLLELLDDQDAKPNLQRG
jgi:DNA (cytosine-5)-methyltransferase 1